MINITITAMLIGLFSSTFTIIEPDLVSIEDYWQQQFEGVDYEANMYDCTQFSNDFNADLASKGVNSSIIYGWYYADYLSYGRGLHCWLSIGGKDFETITGYFINDSGYKPIREVERCP